MKSYYDENFEAFWKAYPRRVGKLAARKAYEKVRRHGVTQHELLDGIAQYVQTKPAYADWCHPTTWLNQGRWMDEPGPVVERPFSASELAEARRVLTSGGRCPHEPRCKNSQQCMATIIRQWRKDLGEAT